MRIIGGKFKGRKINEPSDKLTRPLKDITKESIFNIIKHSNLLSVEIENSQILDLFSGVGSFGLECLSRGSLFVMADLLPGYAQKAIDELREEVYFLKMRIRFLFLFIILVSVFLVRLIIPLISQ